MTKEEKINKLYSMKLASENPAEWNRIMGSLLKPSFFRYRSGNEQDIKSISEGIIWMSKPTNFNDPYDSDIGIDINAFNDSFGIRKKTDKSDIKKIEIILNNTRENIIKSTYIACFTEEKDNLLMWAHYGDSHRGFCVEYDKNDIVKRIQDYKKASPSEACLFIPVQYTKRFTVLNGKDDQNREQWVYAFGKKDEIWKSEKEWRMVISKAAKYGEEIKKKGSIRGKDGIELADIKPINIYMGFKIKEETENELSQLCQKLKIGLYKAKKRKYEFGLEFEKIL